MKNKNTVKVDVFVVISVEVNTVMTMTCMASNLRLMGLLQSRINNY